MNITHRLSRNSQDVNPVDTNIFPAKTYQYHGETQKSHEYWKSDDLKSIVSNSNDFESDKNMISFDDKIDRKIEEFSKKPKDYPFDDSGNTDFIYDILGKKVFYDNALNLFMVYSGSYWKYCSDKFILRAIEKCMNGRRDYILRATTIAPDIQKFAKSCSNHNSLKAILELLKCRVLLDDQHRSQFDSKPYLLN